LKRFQFASVRECIRFSVEVQRGTLPSSESAMSGSIERKEFAQPARKLP
jgi:hypothetical protein